MSNETARAKLNPAAWRDGAVARGCVALASVCSELLAQIALAAADAVAVAQVLEA